MPPDLIVLLSVSVLAMLHNFLKLAFAIIEKAHEHQRTPGPRTSGVQRSGEKAAC